MRHGRRKGRRLQKASHGRPNLLLSFAPHRPSLAVACGLSVANIYCAQPLLDSIRA